MKSAEPIAAETCRIATADQSSPAPLGSEVRENRASDIQKLATSAKALGLELCWEQPVGYQNIKTGVHATVTYYDDLLPSHQEKWMPLFARAS